MRKIFKKLLLMVLVFNSCFFSINLAEAGYIEPEVARLVSRVLSDKSWRTVYQNSNDIIMIHERYMNIEGSREKPKVDVWEMYIQNDRIVQMNRVRYYFGKKPVQSKNLMIVTFNDDYSLDSCYQTGVTASKKNIKENTVDDLIQYQIYNFLLRNGYFNNLK